MIRPLVVALTVSLAAPLAAEPNAQLVSSVQHRLNVLGFDEVDARILSTRQIAALHMQLRGPVFGRAYVEKRQRVKVILNWEAQGRRTY